MAMRSTEASLTSVRWMLSICGVRFSVIFSERAEWLRSSASAILRRLAILERRICWRVSRSL